MREIPLTKGYVALVDDEDYERVMQYRWSTCIHYRIDGSIKGVYAQRGVRKDDGKWTTQLLHRFLMKVSDPKIQVDHRNHDGLDNRRDNLRNATSQQNHANRSKLRGTSSKQKGVSWHKRDKKWRAQGEVNGIDVYLGYFDSELEASRAYNVWALETFGEFACLN